MEVALAIPNYNGAGNLSSLLTRVVEENFDHIYVLDDVSTDNSKEITKAFPQATFIEGKNNKGPAGNRNRILKHDCGDIIMFLDVDMELLVKDLKEKILGNFADENVALVGGLIHTPKDEPMWWNYGFEMHPDRDAQAKVVHDWALDNWNNKEKIDELRKKFHDVTPNLDISFGEPGTKDVDWVSEANFCVRAEVFREIGGFDGKMRYLADQDLCKRVRQKNYRVQHSPSIKTIHLEIDTFGETREKIRRENSFYFYKKHWNMTREIFNLLLPQQKVESS